MYFKKNCQMQTKLLKIIKYKNNTNIKKINKKTN